MFRLGPKQITRKFEEYLVDFRRALKSIIFAVFLEKSKNGPDAVYSLSVTKLNSTCQQILQSEQSQLELIWSLSLGAQASTNDRTDG